MVKIVNYDLGRTINKSARPFPPSQHRDRRNCSREDHILLTFLQKKKHQVTELIREKCLIKVLLNNKLSSVLLDTGAQFSAKSHKYLRENFAHVDEYPVN